jgi:predicted MFS family arabinose efflux permease
MDRALPGILVEPIRHEFKLKDSQLGLLSTGYGVAFAFAVIPMGMLSDRLNRRSLLAGLLAVWSACTAVAGFAGSVAALILARVGVGAAESGGLPISMPLLSDIFPPRQRGLAYGVYYMNTSLGGLLASVVGALVAAHFGWRAAFLLVGAPGVLLALVLLLTVKEPVRGAYSEGRQDEGDRQPKPRLMEALVYLAQHPALLCLMVATMLVSVVATTQTAWLPAFFMRTHNMTLAQVGVILGLGSGLSGAVGPPLFGWLADRLSARDPAWMLRIVWLCLALSCLSSLVALFSGPVAAAVGCSVFAEFLRAGFAALTFIVITNHSPVPMRGTIMSFVQLATVLAGYGLGPWLIGVLSDVYGGGAAIRYALADSMMLFLIIVPLYIIASRILYGRTSSGVI